MKDRLFEALKKADADYAEIRYENEDGTNISFRKDEVENAEGSSFCGGIVRACKNGGWGVSVFDSIEGLEHQVREACRCAAIAGHERTELAETKIVDEERPAVFEKDFRGVTFDEKLKLVKSYNKIILGAGPEIQSSGVSYYDSMRTVHFANTRGSYFMEARPRITFAYSATAGTGSLIQKASDNISSKTNYGVVLCLEDNVKKVAERAIALLKAPKCDGGAHTVILNRRLGGVFVHEAFGHLSEADFIYENPKMRELMVPGKKMGVEKLNIFDDGSFRAAAGTISFDDEGTPAGKNCLIRNGVLAGHLHSLETAAKMGAKPTGNARAVRRFNSPIVRMTNTYIENGDMPIEELFAGVDDGIYACDAFGGQTMFEMFTFSAAYGYRIRNGKIGELVRDVVLTGNVFEILNNIDGIANDFEMLSGAGGCGKGGQFPLPVGFGAPHIRIRNVVVGGK